CFDHARSPYLRLSASLRKRLKPIRLQLSSKWKTNVEKWCNRVRSDSGIRVARDAQTARLHLAEEMWQCRLPKHEVPVGSFRTDVVRVQIITMDITRAFLHPRVGKAMGEAKQAMPAPDGWTVSSLFRTTTSLVQKSFCNTRPLAKYHRLIESGSLVKILQIIPSKAEKTRKGLPADDATSSPHIKRLLARSLVETGHLLSEEECSDEWLRQISIAGDDTGIVFPEAIAVNDPSNNRSESLLLGARGLQELSRASQTAKAAQAATFPIDFKNLRANSSSSPFRAAFVYSFAHHLYRSSRHYCTDTYFRKLRRTALENRLFQQTRNLLFPKQSSLKRIKSEALPARPIRHMPVLFAVGDCCGFTRQAVRRHTADFANPSTKLTPASAAQFPPAYVPWPSGQTTELGGRLTQLLKIGSGRGFSSPSIEGLPTNASECCSVRAVAASLTETRRQLSTLGTSHGICFTLAGTLGIR
ncbi:MAG: hypothetical protein CYPHOPRED_004390, partial [Cyphobasidiales sp. Tagirdzhanova-0007]